MTDDTLIIFTADPGETRNLAGEPKFKARRNELAAEMEAWLKKTKWSGEQ